MLPHGLTRRLRGGGPVARGSADLLVGEPERGIVACPACGRPVATTEGRCPGCGTFLVAGVRLRTAGFLVLVGCVLGMLGGALVAGVAMSPRLAAGDAAIAAVAAGELEDREPAPATTMPYLPLVAFGPPAPMFIPSQQPADLPAGVEGALLQVLAVNDRLAASTESLEGMLAVRKPRASELATLIRRVVADARSGADAAARLDGWAPGALLSANAAALYTSLASTASDGLVAPLGDRAAYVAAGRTVLAALGGLPDLAGAAREVAQRAGVAVPAQH